MLYCQCDIVRDKVIANNFIKRARDNRGIDLGSNWGGGSKQEMFYIN